MKQYYYAENGQQFGPFTIEELSVKKIKKETLVWYDGLGNWVSAGNVDELKSILVSTPPPLHQEEISNNSNYEYQKEYDVTIVGVCWAVLFLILNKTDILSGNDAYVYVIWTIILFVIRVLSVIMANDVAKRQNRNTLGWGLFALGTPSVSLIILGLLNRKKLN